jgi:protein ImuB
MKGPDELYACLYAKEFPAQALLRLRPDLRYKPCVVMDGDPPLQQVCSLNTRARSLGMVRGMTRVEVDTSPLITVIPRSHKEEAATERVLLECSRAFSPRVEDKSENDAFLCVIDIVGAEKLFGPPETLARDLLARVKALGVIACVAISRNIHAASALAKGLSWRSPLKIISTGEEGAALASLPLTVLDLTEEQQETFSLWGIHTLGMLADLPEKDLIARMGQSGKRLRQTARGEMPHIFQPDEPAFVLEERMELESPVELLDALLFVVSVMLDQLIQRAKSRVLSLASINITLILEDAAMHTCQVRTALPTNDKQLWIKLLHLELEAHPPPAAILAMTVAAEPGCINKTQLGLFSSQSPESTRLDVTLARIRAIVGEDCVGRPVLSDTHQWQGFRIEPFTVSSGSGSGLIASSSQSRSAVRKLRPAENISVTIQNNRPKTFVFREMQYIVKKVYGPWMISGDWWNSSLWGLEQWDLVAYAQERGQLYCCVMRDLMQGCWQMAALYD